MREALERIDCKRSWFGAIYTGSTESPKIAQTLKSPPLEPLALLQAVFVEEEMVSDHLWTSWSQQFRAISPGSKVEFVATVRAYNKGLGRYNYGLRYPVWVQEPGIRKTILKRPKPETKEDASYLLSLFGFAYSEFCKVRLSQAARPTEQEIAEHFEKGGSYNARFREWNDEIPRLIELLAHEGWGDPNPRPLDFWMERSRVLAEMANYRDATIQQCCQIASWMNGATAWQAFGED